MVKYDAAVLAWQNRAGCTIEEAADDVAFIFEVAEVERNERLHRARDTRALDAAHKLIANLSAFLADEGDAMTPRGLDEMRRRVANALPPARCPAWLAEYRDPPVVRSE